MKTVLLTGGIGSGKSLVSNFLESLGVPVYDSDSRTKDLYKTDGNLCAEIGKAVGAPVLLQDGGLDLKALSKVVFSDRDALLRLEEVVHPRVKEDFLKWRDSLSGGIAVMESAIALSKPLFGDLFDSVVLVWAPEEVRIERAARRDNKAASRIEERVRAQQFDLSRVDAVINNDSDEQTLRLRTRLAFKVIGCPLDS